MNARTIIALAVAIALGIAATLVGRSIVMGNRTIGISTPTVTEIVVAKTDLEPGQLIEAADVMLAEMPTSSLSPSMFRDTKALVGRAVISPVVKGQAMFEQLLAPPGSEGGLSSLVPDGMRAVSVDVNESSAVAGLLTPGSRVDVIATLRPDQRGQIARTIVENVKVQAVNRRLSKTERPDEKAASVKTVTLIVAPKDAEAIELASNTGRLRLVLRGTSDMAPTQSPGVTFAELTGQVTSDFAMQPYNESGQPGEASDGGDAPAGHVGFATPDKRPIRQAVRIIRGTSESTIYYELRPNLRKDGKEDWSVANPPSESAKEQDPFVGGSGK